ncbi:hypothetical protein ACJJIQ_07440 [Microbulbifer sp. ANSA003]|uniref:hypothetical protein n=1 Tax=unclassified Microbulbifer TaxID=2619833 RepID=UPI004039E0CA
MKKITIILFLLLSTLLAGGCASQVNKAMQSWVGHHKADLIASWGPPNQVADDGRGGEILIYNSYVNLGQTPGRVQTDYWGNTTYTVPQQNGYQRTRMFYVNPEGYIYNWRWQGL